MTWRALLALAGLLLLVSCRNTPPAVEAKPALWEVHEGAELRGWLFGTMHSLPEPAIWQEGPVESALSDARRVALEIAEPGNSAQLQRLFHRLAFSAPSSVAYPPIEDRVAPKLRIQAAQLARKSGISAKDARTLKSWAAALLIVQANRPAREGISVDEELAKIFRGRPVLELEGAEMQLGLFDALPEQQQRSLLEAVIKSADDTQAEARRLFNLWRTGAMDGIAAETDKGMLADPALRAELLVKRNHRWTKHVDGWLRNRDAGPIFIAAGAAHMAGPDGLPALLSQMGWDVRRIQ